MKRTSASLWPFTPDTARRMWRVAFYATLLLIATVVVWIFSLPTPAGGAL